MIYYISNYFIFQLKQKVLFIKTIHLYALTLAYTK